MKTEEWREWGATPTLERFFFDSTVLFFLRTRECECGVGCLFMLSPLMALLRFFFFGSRGSSCTCAGSVFA